MSRKLAERWYRQPHSAYDIFFEPLIKIGEGKGAQDLSLHEAISRRQYKAALNGKPKQAVLQAFCIPVEGSDDPDAATHRVRPAGRDAPDPDQGWEQWSSDIEEMIRVCQTGEALDRIQASYRAELRAASKRRPDLFTAIGAAMQARRAALGPAVPGARKPASSSEPGTAAATAKVAAHA